ncbi:MAG: acetylglutamate kinase, partial [Actinomycetota bacterium]|nr:acetylglutamate kinase [Actinomycetota bacterium]
ARRRSAVVDGEPVDVGLVGDITRVDPTFVTTVLDDGLVPVVSSVARGVDGQTYNINADTAASALAVSLGARKLVVLTDVAGLHADWPDTADVVSEISAAELRDLLPSLATGMIPKMEACLRAVEGGVPQAHVLDGRTPHALLLEVFTDEGIGTQVVASAAVASGTGGAP